MLTDLQSYLDYLRIERQVSPHTVRNYQRQLEAILILLAEQDIQNWQQITPSVVRFILAQSKKKDLKKKVWHYVYPRFGCSSAISFS
ncbi:tyrosine recombinase XerC [Rodentibacter pneumotropicus]|uniref:Tyrosine recombinase XerC n=1 Tax=Rodentibacter pneumotropicus TaxID=758 RepID=A0A3S4VC57_9PAST|nr:tyrosine recombinase XerC [Rodentibacter pneumotropicus]